MHKFLQPKTHGMISETTQVKQKKKKKENKRRTELPLCFCSLQQKGEKFGIAKYWK